MKVFFVGLATLLCFAGAEALRCNVCKRKFLLFGCMQGSGETTCGWRERCVNIKASLELFHQRSYIFTIPKSGKLLTAKWNYSYHIRKLPIYYRLNCTSVLNCGKVRAPDESHLTYDYTCCNTDFCN